LTLTFSEERFVHNFQIIDGLFTDIVIGFDFMSKYNCVTDLSQEIFFMGGAQLAIPLLIKDNSLGGSYLGEQGTIQTNTVGQPTNRLVGLVHEMSADKYPPRFMRSDEQRDYNRRNVYDNRHRRFWPHQDRASMSNFWSRNYGPRRQNYCPRDSSFAQNNKGYWPRNRHQVRASPTDFGRIQNSDPCYFVGAAQRDYARPHSYVNRKHITGQVGASPASFGRTRGSYSKNQSFAQNSRIGIVENHHQRNHNNFTNFSSGNYGPRTRNLGQRDNNCVQNSGGFLSNKGRASRPNFGIKQSSYSENQSFAQNSRIGIVENHHHRNHSNAPTFEPVIGNTDDEVKVNVSITNDDNNCGDLVKGEDGLVAGSISWWKHDIGRNACDEQSTVIGSAAGVSINKEVWPSEVREAAAEYRPSIAHQQTASIVNTEVGPTKLCATAEYVLSTSEYNPLTWQADDDLNLLKDLKYLVANGYIANTSPYEDGSEMSKDEMPSEMAKGGNGMSECKRPSDMSSQEEEHDIVTILKKLLDSKTVKKDLLAKGHIDPDQVIADARYKMFMFEEWLRLQKA